MAKAKVYGGRIEVGHSLENVRKHLDAEPDPKKRAEMARKARELRGHGVWKMPAGR
jgi:hypothetical protein